MRRRSVWLLVAAVAACKSDAAGPVVEIVANPLGGWRTSPNEAYARNLWDLQEFRGRLYLGYGDAIANTGPTQVLVFDPAARTLTQEAILDEEAINTLRVFGDKLYVPGPDAVGSSDGALYVRDEIGWNRIVLPDVLHASDVLVHGDALCVAVQDAFNGGAVRCSRDEGATWSTYSTGSYRAVSLFQRGDVLHVSSHDVGVQRTDGKPVKLELEGVDPSADVLVTKAVRCGRELVFLGKQITYSTPPDIQVFGVFHASDTTSGVIAGKRSDVRGTPSDLFASGERCYTVANQRTEGGYRVTIDMSEDGLAWHPAFDLASEAMVRSAEIVDRQLYLGTGCEIGRCDATAGRLLRARASVR